MLESGPAAGVIGTQALCRTLGLENAIAFDMGGTTAKAGVIYKGEPLTTGSALLGGYEKALPIQIAMMDIFEVGTGGGSIARVEDGMLRVGPQSAGRAAGPRLLRPRRHRSRPSPTPISCSAGSRADRFLGGEMRLDTAAAQRRAAGACRRRRSASDVTAAADGILRIAATAMSYAVKGVTTERGLDAGDFALVAYGGAGPLHAVDGRARDSACAGSSSRPRRACSRPSACCSRICATISCAPGRRGSTSADSPTSSASMASSRTRAAAPSPATSVAPRSVTIKRAADMRYVGQEHAVTVDLPMERVRAAGPRRDQAPFRRACTLCATAPSAPDERAEIVSLRTTVTGVMRKPPQEKIARGQPRAAASAAFTGKRAGLFRADGGFVDTPTYARAGAPRRQPHRRPGAGRGACLDHRAHARRQPRGRPLRQSLIAVGRADAGLAFGLKAVMPCMSRHPRLQRNSEDASIRHEPT